MNDKRTINLIDPARREWAKQCIDAAPEGYVVQIRPSRRTTAQSDKMWAMIGDLIDNHVPGCGYKSEYVKGLAMEYAGHKPVWIPSWNEDGTMVCVGYKSSRLTVSEMSDLIEAINEYAASRGFVLRG